MSTQARIHLWQRGVKNGVCNRELLPGQKVTEIPVTLDVAISPQMKQEPFQAPLPSSPSEESCNHGAGCLLPLLHSLTFCGIIFTN